jgi:DNA modification methylase
MTGQAPYRRKEVIEAAEFYQGDCRDVLRILATDSIDSIVTDPPYELGFMGKGWDRSGIANDISMWKECLRVLKPGGHMLAFSGSRTYHRMACAIEDAGFEIRDQIMWIYGSGFPKSLDVSKAFDKAAGIEREIIGRRTDRAATPKRDMRGGNYIGASENIDLSAITAPATEDAQRWEGWGTALKPAHEPIVLARKPIVGTVINNISSFGTGALNIDACRIPIDEDLPDYTPSKSGLGNNGIYGASAREQGANSPTRYQENGRWPANIIHDGSEEVLAAFPDAQGQQASVTGNEPSSKTNNVYHPFNGRPATVPRGDTGSAARFYYCAKASKEDRDEGLENFTRRQYSHDGREKPIENAYQRNNSVARNHHPTVKPTDLMRWLCRLITPPLGIVLDPFMGSGSTGKAAVMEGFSFIGIEQDEEYFDIAVRAFVTPSANRTCSMKLIANQLRSL